MRNFSLLMVATLLVACGETNLTGSNPLVNEDFAPELNVDLSQMTRTSTGLYVQDLAVGTGAEATNGDTIVVHYEGWLIDGTKFDSSRDRNIPFEFLLGDGDVILGWDEGVAGMLVGGMRKLVIPPNLGYGPAGLGAIPGNATLVFDIELLEVKP